PSRKRLSAQEYSVRENGRNGVGLERLNFLTIRQGEHIRPWRQELLVTSLHHKPIALVLPLAGVAYELALLLPGGDSENVVVMTSSLNHQDAVSGFLYLQDQILQSLAIGWTDSHGDIRIDQFSDVVFQALEEHHGVAGSFPSLKERLGAELMATTVRFSIQVRKFAQATASSGIASSRLTMSFNSDKTDGPLSSSAWSSG